MINSSIYQSIFDELSVYLVHDWEELIVYLEYEHSSYSIDFYEKINGEYIKCYDLPGISEDDLDSSFRRIDNIVVEERKTEKNDLWTNLTMLVSSDGNMHADLDYTDLSYGSYQYRKLWKKKYLV